jgi:tetratricopeptide (TPR) repeat protein
MVQRIMAHWLVRKPGVSHCNRLSLDGLRLHDGAVRRICYVARTLTLPGALHVARNPFPGLFSSLPAYIPIKIARDIALLPLVRTHRYVLARAELLRDALASHELALIVMPLSAEMRLRLRRHHEARADANRALAADPNNPAAWHRLGNALCGLKRHKAAIACYNRRLRSRRRTGRFGKIAPRRSTRVGGNRLIPTSTRSRRPTRRMPMRGPFVLGSFWLRSELERRQRQAIARYRSTHSIWSQRVLVSDAAFLFVIGASVKTMSGGLPRV